MRLLVARCEVRYSGRLNAVLSGALAVKRFNSADFDLSAVVPSHDKSRGINHLGGGDVKVA